jgi:hypothetical protein
MRSTVRGGDLATPVVASPAVEIALVQVPYDSGQYGTRKLPLAAAALASLDPTADPGDRATAAARRLVRAIAQAAA